MVTFREGEAGMSPRCVVFGGSSGIGAATVRLFARRGAEVVALARDGRRLADRCAGLAGVSARPLDARDRAALAHFAAEVGPFDHLVMSIAGGAALGPFAQLSTESLLASLAGKALPYVEATRLLAPSLRPGGSVTWVTGLSSQRAVPGAASLGAINGLLEGLLPTLAVELAPLRINAVSPGHTDTEAWSRLPAGLGERLAAEAAAATPLGRVATPEDVADAIYAVATSPFLTGAVIPCDGGKRLR
jgi:NAD(P)-dependent dehydrogenase (short-subunit alcohol dehydrogenase family)